MSEADDAIVGFEDASHDGAAAAGTQLAERVLEEINKQLKIYTSTPLRNIMDFSFLKCYEHVVGAGLQPQDSDSGYMSNPLEGTLEKEDPTMFINKSPPFMSEDALQEKPASVKKTPNQDVYQEQLQISYLNSLQEMQNFTQHEIVISDTDDETEISPIIPVNKMPMVFVFEQVDEGSSSSNKENINLNFEKMSMEKMANVKLTPRKTPKKRRRSSSTNSNSTPKKAFISNISADMSPDLFDDEVEVEPIKEVIKPERFVACEQYIHKFDLLLKKRIGRCLSGVLPPPSFTTTHITVAQMLEKLNNEKHQKYFWDHDRKEGEDNVDRQSESSSDVISQANCTSGRSKSKTILVNTSLESCKERPWPLILYDRCHGLNYNHSKHAEDTESLFMKYSQRYVGLETQSSCTVFDSHRNTPSKKRANRLRWVNKSPGRRLSHLARRRITFSSANIAAGGSSHSRQIMVDAKRFELLSRRVSPRKSKSPRKTPKKGKGKTPRKSKTPKATNKMRTPSSSMKKRLAFKVLDEENIAPSTSTSSLRASATKRALFQSPDKNITVTKLSRISVPSTSNPSTSPWKKRTTPKRALFNSPSKPQEGNKRKRLDSEDSIVNCKFARSISLQNENSAQNKPPAQLTRVRSESLLSGAVIELSDLHKKKLQWAVYEALRSVNIRMDHENFKQYASVLARVTRRLLPTVSAANIGTSERMLRITKQHVYAVTKGKTMEEIIRNYENNRLRVQKPTGYISKEDVIDSNGCKEKIDISVARSNVFQDCANTIQSTEKKNLLAVDKKISDNKVDRVKKIIKF